MAKKESSFKNMVITLFLVTFISSGTLGFVYELTKEPIRMVEINKKNEAIKQVIPEFSNDPYRESFKVPYEKDSLTFYPAKADGKLIGMAVETYTNKGFSGLITLMVGFKMDGTITSIKVLSHQETPGLGQKIERSKSNFEVQFEGKNPSDFKLTVKKDRGDVDAITASTISSRAYCDAVQRAYNAFISEKEKLNNEKN